MDESTYELLAQSDVRPDAAKAIVEAGGRLRSLELDEPNLDEIYARYFQEVRDERASVAA